ncbi:5-amino-6-(5-phospho-D-ribitylamino)uracil phosphatase, chloroplastic isoform X2 [Cryptomeria japonica]|uniref:5-amino-6-(5-phospho-D-ribitylamino)uracil phosphatase, chloroplastic isoform X2 n=1 Tax=Cryptomeria japonica TaxID=3369 RepID=UPI0025AD29BE|nr:5-amino-6-(5-phospho-D-ribitylamino)uracil phosphatase, chloroplastic isoform X2 [Cryptomeria japonica]
MLFSIKMAQNCMDCRLKCCCSAVLSSAGRFRRAAPKQKLNFTEPRKQGGNKLVVTSKAADFGERDCNDGFPIIPKNPFSEEAIGAEYGEAFEAYKPNGPLEVDVDFLNDRLRESGLQRIRYSMKPDEAFGLIFSWDNVVADTWALRMDAWNRLASEEGKLIPDDIETQRRMLSAGAEHVLCKVLFWEKARDEVERLKLRLSEIFYEELSRLQAPMEGLKDWLEALYTAGVPCAITSSLDRQSIVAALERMGLRNYFQAIVADEDGMESIAQRFLSAAVKLERPPSKCVVFEDDPRGITAAHNCTMVAVALIGSHPAYELVQADLAVASFSELSVFNLRRLFANKGSKFMDLQKQVVEKSPSRRKLTVDTIF